VPSRLGLLASEIYFTVCGVEHEPHQAELNLL